MRHDVLTKKQLSKNLRVCLSIDVFFLLLFLSLEWRAPGALHSILLTFHSFFPSVAAAGFTKSSTEEKQRTLVLLGTLQRTMSLLTSTWKSLPRNLQFSDGCCCISQTTTGLDRYLHGELSFRRPRVFLSHPENTVSLLIKLKKWTNTSSTWTSIPRSIQLMRDLNFNISSEV